MALTSWSTTNYLTRTASIPVSAYPYFFSCWGSITASAAGYTAMFLGIASEFHRHANLYLSGTPRVQIQYRDGTNINTAIATTVHPTDGTWFHMAAELLATNSHAVLLNGGNRGAEATTITPNAPDRFTLGVRQNGASSFIESWFNTGGLAEASIWDGTGMTAANMNSLAAKLYNGGAGGAGGNPLNITAEAAQPWTGKLVAYWLDSANTITDLAGNGYDLTMQGTLTTFGSHPTIEAVTGGASTDLMAQICL